MEVIAKTKQEYLIQATEAEIKEIINAVTGEKPVDIKIGQKIPAIDYASTIRKIKNLNDDSYYKNLISYGKHFNDQLNKLSEVVKNASLIEKL